MLTWQEKVSLAGQTTIGLGGPARFFVTVATVDELKTVLREAEEKNLPVHILGGGSNTVFTDAGFDGLVIKIDLKGIEFVDDGEYVVIIAQAGEVWEPLAAETVRRNLAGFECLAGIPGTVGGTPIQNVGAYGQDVSQTIREVVMLDRQTLEEVRFTNADCHFSYRNSRFKGADSNRYVIVAVTFVLQKNGAPCLKYQHVIESAQAFGSAVTLANVREIVLGLRRAKSMVLDPRDPHTRSCGSFFTNPRVSRTELASLQQWSDAHKKGSVPHFPGEDGGELVPAAWLIEQVGYHKGLRRGGVGISLNHPLALVNYGGTTAELLALAEEIMTAVKTKFSIALIHEPVVV